MELRFPSHQKMNQGFISPSFTFEWKSECLCFCFCVLVYVCIFVFVCLSVYLSLCVCSKKWNTNLLLIQIKPHWTLLQFNSNSWEQIIQRIRVGVFIFFLIVFLNLSFWFARKVSQYFEECPEDTFWLLMTSLYTTMA